MSAVPLIAVAVAVAVVVVLTTHETVPRAVALIRSCLMNCTSDGSTVPWPVIPSSFDMTVLVLLSSSNIPAPAVASSVPPAATHDASAVDAFLLTCVSAR